MVHEAERLWGSCVEALRPLVPPAVWKTTFESTRAIDLRDSELVVVAPNTLVKDRIEKRFAELVSGTLAEVGGKEIDVTIELRPDIVDERPLALVTDDHEEPAYESPYTFDAFVTGASNRFAHAAALAVAETPGRSFNPLFIYGAAGLGKTHLLHAIGSYVHQHYPHMRVRYVSLEAFMNDFVEAIRTNARMAFKRRYRENDVLLVDDLQFLEGKEGLQEEFFYTFNELHGSNRQIVLCSDRPPRAIATLEERLRSRFEGGLITDIQPPELETRLAILRKKSEPLPIPIPPEVLELIATHITNNIRELEGALTRVAAFGSLNRAPLTLELAREVLSDMLSNAKPRIITADIVIEATALLYQFSVEELRGTSRRRPLVTARQVGMYVCRQLTELSYPAIARSFGGRDHTTVIYSVEKIQRLMVDRRDIYDQVTELTTSIRTGG
ncbi:MAG: chromosomal replication initiator protein DnaA [Actinomycetota bacterium]|nr:chromosomal replication initiator protein DnaA [Actinomycetota bacterium]